MLDLIFVLGLTQRTGSNFLTDVLHMHPNLCADQLSPEELESKEAKFLSTYLSEKAHLVPTTPDADKLRVDIQNKFKNYQAKLLENREHLVLKHTNSRGLQFINDTSPEAKVIVLLRDGRDMAISYNQQWPDEWPLPKALKYWQKEAQYLINILENKLCSTNQLYVLRFEDLITRGKKLLPTIFDFLGLDPDLFPYHKMESLNSLGGTVDKLEDFEPNRRARFYQPIRLHTQLGALTNWRLKKLAKEELKYFNYV